MVIEISTDSETWLQVKHAIREAGLKYFLQDQLFSMNKTLFVEPRAQEPEGGKLNHGMLVYDGGSTISSAISEVYETEVQSK